MITQEQLASGQNGMLELMYGDKAPSLLFALRIGALSAMQPLEMNGKMARFLAPYATTTLPFDDVTLQAALKAIPGPKACLPSHRMALFAIDELFRTGVLAQFEYVPSDFEGQKEWRERLVKLIKGMSHKTVSMALLIYAPLACQLVPIDRHHLKRYGLDPHKSLPCKRYLALEALMLAERNEAGYQAIPLGTYCAALWGVQRDGIDAYCNGHTSHQKLSCRWY